MREPIKDKGRLEHMLEMAMNLDEARKKHNFIEIQQDKILFFGLSKMVEILGEAAYKISNDFKEANSELPWRQIMGMRHILVHGYYTVSPEILWDVIEHDIPNLIPILRNYISQFKPF